MLLSMTVAYRCLCLQVLAGLLLLMMSSRNDGREINFQEFLNSLLVDGRVDHLQVRSPPPNPLNPKP